MKKLMNRITDIMADAAMLEMGVSATVPVAKTVAFRETLEENFIEIAFAEAAEYDQIHKAILREHGPLPDIAQPDDCQYGDNDICIV